MQETEQSRELFLSHTHHTPLPTSPAVAGQAKSGGLVLSECGLTFDMSGLRRQRGLDPE